MPDPSVLQIVILSLAALGAGLVDAIAGGGGLITLPALLAVGVPPHAAIGTNKGQSVWGSGAALASFWRSGKVDRRSARFVFPIALVGATIGAMLVLRVPREALRSLVLVLLLVAAAVLAFRRKPKAPAKNGADEATDARVSTRPKTARIAIIAFVIALYDGFFGPGTGTFLVVAYVALLGATLTHATADAKVVNFGSNVAAVALFSLRGTILWKLALPMALGQLVGGWFGARIAVKGGDRLIRFVVLIVVAALVAKLAFDIAHR